WRLRTPPYWLHESCRTVLSESLSQDGAASLFRRVIPSANVHTHIRGYERGAKFQETTGCTERHLFFISEEYGSFSGKIVAVERDTHSVYVDPDLASPGLPTHQSGFGFSFLPDDFAEESALVIHWKQCCSSVSPHAVFLIRIYKSIAPSSPRCQTSQAQFARSCCECLSTVRVSFRRSRRW
ncbi:hypothetical protein TGPRC2_220070, partial [Toxoplasma gondii TgCatPRC2]